MLTLNEIRQALQDRRVGMVAEATGLHYNTVRQIRDGVSNAPSYRTISALSDYLQGKSA
jgi:hypothetical protein